jgi:hypothetical protein
MFKIRAFFEMIGISPPGVASRVCQLGPEAIAEQSRKMQQILSWGERRAE